MTVFAQSLGGADVRWPQLIFANHHVDATLPQQSKIAPAAEIAVRQDHVAIAQRS